jgi:hypothetical protein
VETVVVEFADGSWSSGLPCVEAQMAHNRLPRVLVPPSRPDV